MHLGAHVLFANCGDQILKSRTKNAIARGSRAYRNTTHNKNVIVHKKECDTTSMAPATKNMITYGKKKNMVVVQSDWFNVFIKYTRLIRPIQSLRAKSRKNFSNPGLSGTLAVEDNVSS